MQQKASRTENVAKNIAWGYIANVLTMVFSFISRTVFIYTLGSEYLGLNGLFTNVLGILSFTELGIGNVLNYSLYKPLAMDDKEKVKSLMAVYKKAYRWVMVVVLAIGLAICPFLPNMIKDAQSVEHVYLYYGFFLFNTVTSYMVSYKNGLMSAAQKEYAVTNVMAVLNFFMVVVQCCSLVLFKNYLLYLTIQAIFQFLQRIIVSLYVDRQFPLLKEKNVQKLPDEEKAVLKENVEAMVYHKVGDVCVSQTDNIIVSTFISLSAVGKISNYTLITSSLTRIISIIFNNSVASIGNFVATESKERRKSIFKVYNFLAFWIYGIISVELFVLFQPFVKIWAGKTNLIDTLTMALMVFNFYLTGLKVAVANFKTACGIFQADKYIGIVQAVVNLVVSIILAKLIGLPEVYIGTLAQGLVDVVWRPWIVYKRIFKEPVREYYIVWFKYIGILIVLTAISYTFTWKLLAEISLIRIFMAAILIFIVINLILYLLFRKTEEMKYLEEKLYLMFQKIWRGKVRKENFK